jgi:hypothetical protein
LSFHDTSFYDTGFDLSWAVGERPEAAFYDCVSSFI